MVRLAVILTVLFGPVAADPVDLLGQLRTHLERVRAATPPAADFGSARPSLEPLVGLARDDLHRHLGAPTHCGASGEVVPCAGAHVWWFSFYKLASTAFGGGLELVVSFDASEQVESARWIQTQ